MIVIFNMVILYCWVGVRKKFGYPTPDPNSVRTCRFQTRNQFNWVWVQILGTGVDRFWIRVMKVGTEIGYPVEHLIFQKNI